MTKTAKALYMAQPAVSIALSELEEHYKIRLFDRVSRKLYITEAGKQFYNFAKRIVDMFNDVEIAVQQDTEMSQIRVGCCESIDSCALPEYITEFNQVHPGVAVYGSVDVTAALELRHEKNELDFAITDNMPKNSNLVVEKYTAARLVFGASPKLGYTNGQQLTLDELISKPLLLRDSSANSRVAFDRFMQQHNLEVQPAWESPSTTFLLNAAIKGLGIVVLPESMVKHYFKKERLVRLDVTDFDATVEYYIARHKDKSFTPAMRDFLMICRSIPDKVSSR